MAEEVGALQEALTLRSRMRSRLAAHSRSRSMDQLPASQVAQQPAAGGLAASWHAASSVAGAEAAVEVAGPGGNSKEPRHTVSTTGGSSSAGGSSSGREAAAVPEAAAVGRPPLPATAGGTAGGLVRRSSLDVAQSATSESIFSAAPWVRGILPRRATAPSGPEAQPPPPAASEAELQAEQQPLLLAEALRHHQESDWEAVGPPQEREQLEMADQRFSVGHLLAPALLDGADGPPHQSSPFTSTAATAAPHWGGGVGWPVQRKRRGGPRVSKACLTWLWWLRTSTPVAARTLWSTRVSWVVVVVVSRGVCPSE